MFVGSRTTGDKLEIDFGAVRIVGGIITADIIRGGDVNIKYNHVLIQVPNDRFNFIFKVIIISFDIINVFVILCLQVVQLHM